MSYFLFDNKKVFYHEMGEGNVLLLLHGNTASSNMFYGIAEEYAKHFKVVLIDFLGHGQSERLDTFPNDLWFYEAQQVIAFIRYKSYDKVNLIGTSGGALVAINVALEEPGLVNKVIADSFEGNHSLDDFASNIVNERETSKQDPSSIQFYKWMQGDDWITVVDADTKAIYEHNKLIGTFFHKDFKDLQNEILLTGSIQDEFVTAIDDNYFEKVYGDMITRLGHGSICLFESGNHPAMLSNAEEFIHLSTHFLKK